jgi:hypothetical protein
MKSNQTVAQRAINQGEQIEIKFLKESVIQFIVSIQYFNDDENDALDL